MRTIQLHLLLLGWLLALSCARPVEKPKVIAHRGYWQCEGSAQNSIASLVKAHEIGCYGSEFDVHLTADDVPVVCHEVEIRKGVFIPQVPYDSIKDIRLPNGETLPTLDQYLEKGKELEGLQLIYELKTDAAPERNRQAARVAVETVRKHGMEKRVEFITFNLEAAKELRRLAPDMPVYYLSGDLIPPQVKEFGFTGINYYYKVMLERPEWFEEAHALGLKTNVWTVDDAEEIREIARLGTDFLSTDIPEEAMAIIADL